MTRDFRVGLSLAALVAGGFAITMAAFYPGYMPNDAIYVYSYGQEWSFGDWQSPLMSIVWRLIDPLAPGAASMFLLITTLYWLGFGLLALTVARRSVGAGLARAAARAGAAGLHAARHALA